MVLSRSKCEVRLNINGNNLERVYYLKLLGVWLTDKLNCLVSG